MNPRQRVLLLLGWSDPALQLGAMRYAKQAGWVLDSSFGRMGRIPDGRWDGAIALAPPGDNPIRAYLDGLDCPVVDLDNHTPEDGRHRVLTDDEAAGALAAEHFLERGFRHLAFFADDHAPVHVGRWRGFASRLEREGIHPQRLALRDVFRRGAMPFAQALAAMPKPLGIAAIDDDWAVALLLACEEAGLLVPEQVAVLGISNSLAACELAPVCPLSSVDVGMEETAWLAGETLDRLMRGEEGVPLVQRVPPRSVLLRRSTDIEAVEDLRVARALRAIWDRFAEAISAETLAGELGCSRKTLSDAFRLHTGRTVHEEITRRRIRLAHEIAGDSSLSQAGVAGRCGYDNPLVFGRAFRRVTGTNWSDHRRARNGGGDHGRPISGGEASAGLFATPRFATTTPSP